MEIQRFADLALPPALLQAIDAIGYETPSPIQAATIPLLLQGRDVLGQAQTGTGKTAAFALPTLARIDVRSARPQALVLAPTRELAIQVAEAFQKYAAQLPGFHVLPIYGGQGYGPQLSALRRGVHVVVGTPGRVIDHLEKGALDLSALKTLVLDEADEMLRMGFIDDVETILQRTPATRQTALFSATMPAPIRRIAKTYLREPEEITVAAKTTTADNIRQRYWLVSGMQKLDALTRILEAEPFDGMIIFSRTKLGTEELAEKLCARGFSAAAINGDMAQQARERTIGLLKEGRIDILVATDVAARGLDVERISHVVNYDVPYDVESYTHRIGRTGRAGRTGDAILFITPRERNLLRMIERHTRQPVSPLTLPTVREVNDARIARFKEQISATLEAGGLDVFQRLCEEYEREHNVPAIEIAAALAKIARGDEPLLLDKNQERRQAEERAPDPREHIDQRLLGGDARPSRADFAALKKERMARPPEPGMATYRIAVGYVHGVKPGNIVGAMANEGGIDAKRIGRIEIFDDHTLLDLPADLDAATLAALAEVSTAGRRLRIVRDGETPPPADTAASPMQLDKFMAPLPDAPAPAAAAAPAPAPKKKKDKPAARHDFPMVCYRIEVGKAHAKPANIIGAIANEAGLEAAHIGRLEMYEDYSTVELPDGMPKGLLEHMRKVWVGGRQLKMRLDGEPLPAPKKKKEKHA
ncbi:DEAD/DEAH box helicase [Massilia sp. TS11]|uniref:DEAD/DEAH box helicase n=1 Tax=Massilia sp. TS11 TaxID=2908003 RepID=UPI001EDA4130|nr:DEAD/DEAH box helicase [Massilia sp. TS11]MCG2583730.1 DEAD/DEAH box helicase [Massilia sp. TS11]